MAETEKNVTIYTFPEDAEVRGVRIISSDPDIAYGTYDGEMSVIAHAGTRTGKAVLTVSAYINGKASADRVVVYNSIENGGGGGNDFVITLTYDDIFRGYIPDCTYEEALDAYNAGKKIAVKVLTEFDYYGASIQFDSIGRKFYYTVYQSFEKSIPQYHYCIKTYMYGWSDYQIDSPSICTYYDTSYANASPADVASGKTFFNGNGMQVGTANT